MMTTTLPKWPKELGDPRGYFDGRDRDGNGRADSGSEGEAEQVPLTFFDELSGVESKGWQIKNVIAAGENL
jgi:hypothetical protein